MSNSSINNKRVIRSDIFENGITAGFQQKPNGCSNNGNRVHGEIIVTDPSTRANVIKEMKC